VTRQLGVLFEAVDEFLAHLEITKALQRLTEMPSGRIEVRLIDQPGELARLTALLGEQKLNIHSILSYPDGEHRGRTVLRVGTMDVRALAERLCDAGFEVLWPSVQPCRR